MNYRKGRSFEYRVKKKLEKLGFFVVRLASSKPFDLIAFSKEHIIAIECKNYKLSKSSQLNILTQLSQMIPYKHVVVAVAYSEKRKIIIRSNRRISALSSLYGD